MTPPQVQEAKALVRRAAHVIRDDLAAKGLELLDMNLECGVVDGRMVVIDDVSTGNMRVHRDGVAIDGQQFLQYLTG